jgi:hypothetical protein
MLPFPLNASVKNIIYYFRQRSICTVVHIRTGSCIRITNLVAVFISPVTALWNIIAWSWVTCTGNVNAPNLDRLNTHRETSLLL